MSKKVKEKNIPWAQTMHFNMLFGLWRVKVDYTGWVLSKQTERTKKNIPWGANNVF